ncbi:MAG TPA: DUF3596 domain-containing protein [Gammaproteobacteria bacterium]|nr:DUF3596 domain-containing protein [Gammaproteobacteria bacterium]
MGRKQRTGVRAASASSIEISFVYKGKRCREKIRLEPTPANLKRAERHREAILEAIYRGTFDYATTFPNSKQARRLSDEPGANITLEEYLSDWWRKEEKELKASTRTVEQRILFNQIIPAFGSLMLTEVNTPPAKAGGFGLRLKAGLVGRSADSYTTWKSSSGSGGVWFLMYSFHTSSVTLPLVATQYPLAHRCCPQYFFLSTLYSDNSLCELFPFRYCTARDTDSCGGIPISICT